MAKTAWPTTTEITTEVEAFGVTVPDGIVLQDEIDGAVALLERITGYKPFLQDDPTHDELYFDPPHSQILFLPRGAVDIDSVTVGVDPVAETGGTALTENQDYFLRPKDAPNYGKPFDYIEFVGYQSGYPNSIKMDIAEGYAESVEEDLWNALRGYVVAQVIKAALGSGGVLTRETAGPVTHEYDVAPGRGTVDRLESKFMNLAKAYARKSI